MAYGGEFSKAELLGIDRDEWYDPDEEWVECDNCGEDIKVDLEYVGTLLYYKIPGQEECYCKKCFPKVLASVEFHRECEVTSDNYYRRRV